MTDTKPQSAIKNPILTAIVAAVVGGGGMLGFTSLDEVRAEAAATAVVGQRIDNLEREMDDTQLKIAEELSELSDALNNNTLVGARLIERIDALTKSVERLHP